MLVKTPAKKNWFRFGLKLGVYGVVAEVVALGGSYLFYRKLNRDQEFRHYCSENIPFVLEYYYKAGDLFDSEKGKLAREADLQAFAAFKSNQKPSE